MGQRLFLAGSWLLFATLLLAACAEDGASAPTATATVGQTMTPPAGRTGIAEVDMIIEAVLSHDPEAVRPFIRFETVACVGPTPGNLGGPPLCEAGEPPGTPLEVLRAAQCEGHFIRSDDMEVALTSMTNRSVKLYAVVQANEGHRVVFSSLAGPEPQTPAGHSVLVEDGRITFVNFGCGETAQDLVESVPPDEFVLPPPTPTAPADGSTRY